MMHDIVYDLVYDIMFHIIFHIMFHVIHIILYLANNYYRDKRKRILRILAISCLIPRHCSITIGRPRGMASGSSSREVRKYL